MMRKVVSLTAFLMLAVLSCLTAPAVYADEPPQPYLKKTIERDETVPNLYKATIETFVEESLIPVTTYKPIDLVLVMDFADGDNYSRYWENLRSSCITIVQKLYALNHDSRFAIVLMNGDGTSSKFLLLSTNVNQFVENKIRDTKVEESQKRLYNIGAKLAYEVLSNDTSSNAKYCIIWGVGRPGYNSTSESDRYEIAYNFWDKSNLIKNDALAKLYTVYAGSSSHYTSQFADGSYNMNTQNMLDGASSNYIKVNCNGCTSTNLDEVCHYWQYDSDHRWRSRGTNLDPVDSKYLKTAFEFVGIDDVIDKLIEEIKIDVAQTVYVKGPSVELSTDAMVRDVLNSGFNLPQNIKTGDITLQVANCIGKDGSNNYTFDTPKTDSSITASIDKANNKIEVGGFNFSGKYVGVDSGIGRGQKLIVKYPFIIDTSKNTSGNGIETTDEDYSGIFDGGSKFDFDLSGAKADLRTITVEVNGLREGDNAVVNLTNSNNETLRYVVVGDADDRGTIDVKFQRKGTYTASLELSKIYSTEKSEMTTLKEDGDETLVFNCTRNTSVSHAVKHKKYEFR